jgi:hypothetical protein
MKKDFNPMVMLAAVGAGGISVAPFAIFQYIIAPPAKGLVTYASLPAPLFSGGAGVLTFVLQAIMILFATLHFVLMGFFTIKLVQWLQQGGHRSLLKQPLANPVLLTPMLAASMSFNVFIGVIRFFVPVLQDNFQALMLPALLLWGVLWALTLWVSVHLLKTTFIGEFDVHNVHFGWMLYPFTLAMVSVTGTGIAAMAANANVAGIAAFLSLISFTAALFLFGIKLFAIFQGHYTGKGLPARQFLPSLLSVVPILSLFGISFYRYSHYLHNQLGMHAESFGAIMVILFWAFQAWYLFFGIIFLKHYLANDFLKKEYYVSQWALVCPFVGFAVLGAFASNVMGGVTIASTMAVSSLLVAVGVYTLVFSRMLACAGVLGGREQAAVACS